MTRMKTALSFAALVLAVSFVGADRAHANQAFAPAGVCTMARGLSNSPHLIPGDGGEVVNRGTAEEGMVCGVSDGNFTTSSTDVDTIAVYYTDSNDVGYDDVYCRALTTTHNQVTMFIDATVFGCAYGTDGSGAGYNCDTTRFGHYTGSGVIYLRAIFNTNVRTSLACGIPGYTSPGALSTVRTIAAVNN